MNETDAYRKFSKDHKGWFRKLHGNKFQSGLPDILWICNGETRFLEFKIADKPRVPWAKFRLNQHLTMLQMAEHGANVRYVIYLRQDERFYVVHPHDVKENEGVDLDERVVLR